MSAPGPLKTLFLMLSAQPSIQNNDVTVAFGEEFKHAQELAPPAVVMVPIGGPWENPTYVRAVDPDTEITWSTHEQIELWLWAVAPNLPETLPVDSADLVETLRQQVLQALQDQRDPGGLFYKPVRGRWAQAQEAFNRAGRCYVLTVEVEIPVASAPPVNATITKVTQNTPTV